MACLRQRCASREVLPSATRRATCVFVAGSAHHGAAPLTDGRTTFNKPLPNGEPRLRELSARLKRKRKVLVVVHQPSSIGTLVVTVARARGCEVAYLPGTRARTAPRSRKPRKGQTPQAGIPGL
ncbi:IS110 family transposase [Streptomyces brasiliensis]|uniref:IS110 family transposase n=1 Tax=Streptomyces brasiliensis TaxID=1954 RepID=UPI003570C209